MDKGTGYTCFSLYLFDKPNAYALKLRDFKLIALSAPGNFVVIEADV
jgi:hypothetical protein